VYFLRYSYLEYFNKTDVYQGGTTHSAFLEWEYVPVYVREGALSTGDIYEGNFKCLNGTVPRNPGLPQLQCSRVPVRILNAAKNAAVRLLWLQCKAAELVILWKTGNPATMIVYVEWEVNAS